MEEEVGWDGEGRRYSIHKLHRGRFLAMSTSLSNQKCLLSIGSKNPGVARHRPRPLAACTL